MAKVLVIDDEKAIRRVLTEVFELEKMSVVQAENGQMAIDILKKDTAFDIILCDIKMPRMDGMEFLAMSQEMGITAPIVMISGHGTIETAVEAIKQGAYDFIEKPIDLNRLLVTTRNALDKGQLVNETKTLKKKLKKVTNKQIIGQSEALLRILNTIDKVAPTDARVLITGDNGSGKELVARQLHEKSQRAKAPFIEVNCAAIPSELIESELFGHEKGAFTSAIKQRKGKFELAEGGTLFLDEIGDMSASAQAKVLRALQENKIVRVGGDKEITTNVRVVAATNKDFKKEIEEGRFREDLYHRLSVIPLHVPSLNDRLDDIPHLVEHFIQSICKEQGIAPVEIEPEAIKALQKVNWTGNIRQLRNVVERLLILTDGKITAKDVELYA